MTDRLETRSSSALLGLSLLGVLAVIALAAPWVASGDPFAMTGQALAPPGRAHLFGSDDLGRDVLAGVVHGAVTSLIVGMSAAALSAVIGVVVGGLAGMGGALDLTLMRATEFAQALPRFFLVIVLVSLFGGRLAFIVGALGLTAWPATARMLRAQTQSIMERDFVAAARAAGASDVTILLRHVLPLAMPVLAAQISYQAGGAILAEAGLSFLGLGDPTAMSWGTQLGAAQHFVREAWWMAMFPGLAVTLTVVACNLVADAFGERGVRPGWQPQTDFAGASPAARLRTRQSSV
jgi:peptide/nickel transport system permease protein